MTPTTDYDKLQFIQGTLMGLMLLAKDDDPMKKQITEAWQYSIQLIEPVVCGSVLR